MRAVDFEYRGIRLSDIGMCIAKFDDGGTETIAGSEITFNTVSTQHGKKHHLTSVEYEEALTFTLQICKNLCDGSKEEVDVETARDVVRWLNNCGFQKFRPICDEWSGIYLEASFNVSRIEVDGMLVGFELEGFTNSPYAHAEDIVVNIDAKVGEVINIYNKSDEFGYVYPDMEITVIDGDDGNLEIYNAFEDRTTIIKNCKANEVIRIKYPMISSSDSTHKIQNDYNWIFFRLASTFENRLNKITVNRSCNIKLTYSPVVKIWI